MLEQPAVSWSAMQVWPSQIVQTQSEPQQTCHGKLNDVAAHWDSSLTLLHTEASAWSLA